MLNELNNGNGDIHSLVASLMFDELKDIPLKDIKSKFKKLRQEAKGYEFLIAYGGDYNTMMTNFGLSLEDAKVKYDRYMKGLVGVQRYQEYRRKDWWDKGYILLSPLTQYRAHIYDYDKLKSVYKRLTYEFYAKAKPYKGMENKELGKSHKQVVQYIVDEFAKGTDMETIVGPYKYYKEGKLVMVDISTADVYRYPIKHFFKRKADSEKQSINYPIQHSGAACAKIAMVNFFNWICNNNLFSKVKITIIPYDEINCEAPAEIAETVAQQLYTEMIYSGRIFCTRCKLDADMSKLDDSLPTYWIH